MLKATQKVWTRCGRACAQAVDRTNCLFTPFTVFPQHLLYAPFVLPHSSPWASHLFHKLHNFLHTQFSVLVATFTQLPQALLLLLLPLLTINNNNNRPGHSRVQHA